MFIISNTIHPLPINSTQNTGGAISPLHEGFNDPQSGEPVAFVGANDVPDDNSVNTINTQHSNLTASSFERNQTLSPSKAHRNQGMEQVEEDDRTLDSEMNKSYFSRSTLGGEKLLIKIM